jgi:RNA polymerase sigma-70 factor, ECF subfamily
MSDDAELIKAAAAGDVKSFRKLYDRYLDQVTCTVGRYLGPGPDVEDVVQDVFVELHRSLDRVSDPDAFGGWVYRVARNVAISHGRKKSNSVNFVALQSFKEPTSQWGKLKAREKLRALYVALECLSDEQREAIIMYEIEGNTLQEIADATDTSINTIASRVRRGRKQLLKLVKRALSTSQQKTGEKA